MFHISRKMRKNLKTEHTSQNRLFFRKSPATFKGHINRIELLEFVHELMKTEEFDYIRRHAARKIVDSDSNSSGVNSHDARSFKH